MLRKKKNNIFEQQNTDAAQDTGDAASAIDNATKDDLMPEISNESLVESIPDDPTQIDMLNDKLSQLSYLNAQLNDARQKIAELEAEVKRLQSDNDMLVMKLAENVAMQADIQHQSIADVKQNTSIPLQNTKPMSKHVQYKYTTYKNNGYGTWH